MVASVYLKPEFFEQQIGQIHDVLKRAFEEINLPIAFMVYKKLSWLLSRVPSIDIAGIITCTAARAPVYLVADVLLLLIIIIALDSGIYIVLAVVADSYRAGSQDDALDTCFDYEPDVRNLEVGEEISGTKCFLRNKKKTKEKVIQVPTKKKWRWPSKWGVARIFKTYLIRLLVKGSSDIVKALVQVRKPERSQLAV